MLLSHVTTQFRPTTARIDLAAFARNIRRVAARTNTRLMGVVKADAYGHGSVACARVLEQEGIAYAAVATAEEAIELRDAGIAMPILVLGSVPVGAFPALVRHSVACTIASPDDIRALARSASEHATRAIAHIKIDTGMSRLGMHPDELPHLTALLDAHPGVLIEGIFTHFASADADPVYTQNQETIFRNAVAALQDRLPGQKLIHCCASSGIHNTQSAWFDMVRPGIVLYGGAIPGCNALKTEPVMQLETSLVSIRQFPAGTPISYGGTHVCAQPATVGVLPVGYADGFPRALSNIASVLVNGRRAAVLGNICMDMTMIDVTDIPGVAAGTPATLFGNPATSGPLCPTVNDVAAQAGTIPYEIMCGISKRVPRIYT